MKKMIIWAMLIVSLFALQSCKNDDNSQELSVNNIKGIWEIETLTPELRNLKIAFNDDDLCGFSYSYKTGSNGGKVYWGTKKIIAEFAISGNKIEIDCYQLGIIYDVEIVTMKDKEVDVKITGGDSTYKSTAMKTSEYSSDWSNVWGEIYD